MSHYCCITTKVKVLIGQTLGVWGLLCVVVLTSCQVAESPPDAKVISNLRSEFAPFLEELPPLPFYDMDVWYQPLERHLEGRMRVSGVNNSEDTWHQLVFRLYPNLYHYGGLMEIQGITMDNLPMPYRLEADESVAIVPLPHETWIESNQSFVVEMRWTLEFPAFANVSSIYVRFGDMLGFHSAPLFYPALAPYLPGPIPGSGSWWMAEGPAQGDVSFSEASFFAVNLYLPEEYPPVTNGVAVSREELRHACPLLSPWEECTEELQSQCAEQLELDPWTCRVQNLTRSEFVSGPVREFTLITHAGYLSESFDVNGVEVTSYWVPEYADSGRAARDYAVAALRFFTEEFGPYPYPALTIAMAPVASGSMEYPQLNLIGLQLYRDFQHNLEDQIAFSVAHQWWSQLVHNDPVHEPWLDEALSSYAAYLYQERMHGSEKAEVYRLQQWVSPIQYIKNNGRDDPVSLPVRQYASGSDYRILVYHKGAMLFYELRKAIGPLAARLSMSAFVEKHRFGLIDSQMMLDHLWQVDPTTMTLFQQEYLDSAQWR